MSRTVTVVTPENITVTYRLAGFAPRFLAFLVDFALQMLLILIMGFFLSRLSSAEISGIGNIFTAGGTIASYIILFAYPMICEMAWGGRTPGKRLFGLRVVREGGYPINFVSSVLRNVLRFIDFGYIPLSLTGTPLILWGLPGLATIFFSPSYKRIGDYAGGTLVIVEAGYTPYGGREQTELTPNATAFLPYVKNIDRMTVEDYRLIRRFTNRREGMDLVVQAAISDRLARPLIEKLDLELNITYQMQFADLLEAIERRYAEERGVL